MGVVPTEAKKTIGRLTARNKQVLDSLFYSSDILMKGYNVFLNHAKDTGIPEDKIRFYYDNQELTQMFRPLPKTKDKVFVEISTDYPFDRVYIDTMFFTSLNLTIVNALDLFTRYGFSKSFRGLAISSAKVVDAIDEFIVEIMNLGYFPTALWVDAGSEFKDKLKKECDNMGIIVKYTDAKDKAKNSPIEAFNRTIRLSLEKVLSVIGKKAPITSQAEKALKDIVSSYNHTAHSRTNYAPIDILRSKGIQEKVREEAEKRQSVQLINQEYLDVGTSVRIAEKRQVFGKLTPNWSKDLYKIKSFDESKNRYVLEGQRKKYIRWDLMPVDVKNLMTQTITRYEEAGAKPDERKVSRSEARAKKELETQMTVSEVKGKRESRKRTVLDL